MTLYKIKFLLKYINYNDLSKTDSKDRTFIYKLLDNKVIFFYFILFFKGLGHMVAKMTIIATIFLKCNLDLNFFMF